MRRCGIRTWACADDELVAVIVAKSGVCGHKCPITCREDHRFLLDLTFRQDILLVWLLQGYYRFIMRESLDFQKIEFLKDAFEYHSFLRRRSRKHAWNAFDCPESSSESRNTVTDCFHLLFAVMDFHVIPFPTINSHLSSYETLHIFFSTLPPLSNYFFLSILVQLTVIKTPTRVISRTSNRILAKLSVKNMCEIHCPRYGCGHYAPKEYVRCAENRHQELRECHHWRGENDFERAGGCKRCMRGVKKPETGCCVIL